MRSASNLSLEEKIKVCSELYQRGLSTRDIQAQTGIGKSSIPSYLRAAGVVLDGAARTSAKMIGKPGHRKGSTHTAEARQKISTARKGKPTTSGQIRTPEQRERMRQAQLICGAKRKLIRTQPVLFRRAPNPRLTSEERATRRYVRAASKQMLRRILTMSRVRKDTQTEKLLGYSKIELRHHLESKFKPGMSWANRDSFHIDHIVPVADFFRRGIYDPTVINALSNLQPLTPAENRVKSDRVITITDAGAQLGIQVLT